MARKIAETTLRLWLRIPEELRKRAGTRRQEKVADRSMNAEIVHRLESICSAGRP